MGIVRARDDSCNNAPVSGRVGRPVAACAAIAGRLVPVARARVAAHRGVGARIPRPR